MPDRIKIFLIFVLFAYFFHKSALLFLVAYIIAPKKINWPNTFMFSGLCALAIINLNTIQEWFNDQLDYDYGIESTNSGLIFLILILAITVFSVLIVFTNDGNTREARGLINIGFISVFFWVLRLYTRVAERPSFYFLFFSIAAFSYALYIMKNRKEKNAVMILVVVLCLALYIYRFLTNFSTYVPYIFYS